ncbi:MAG: TRAP transporter substrate-binding protein DctP [Pseudomonadota bacterium]
MQADKWIAALFLALAAFVPAAEAITFKVATVAPEGTAWMQELRDAAQRIKEQTEGRVEIKFYPGGVMGSSDTVLRKMRVGQLHGGAFTAGELAGRDEDLLLYGIPFLFDNDAEVAAVRAALDPLIEADLEKAGFTVVGIAGGGFVQLFSDRPVRSAADLKEAKVWTPEGDTVSDLAFRLAGISPVPLSLPDVYTALQTGALDTVVNTTAGAIAFQWHTRMKTMTDFPVAYVLGLMALDRRMVSRLDDGDKDILMREMKAAFVRIEQTNLKDVVAARGAIGNQGIEIVELNSDQRQAWLKLGRDVVARLEIDESFKLDHLEVVMAALAEAQAAQD